MPERRRVLLVDDNAALVENLGEILEDSGYRVTAAGTCDEARRRAPGVRVALVDVRLPDGSGIELANELKQGHPDCEVVLMTGHASTESAAQAVRAGAFAYLVKPASTPDLLLTIEQAMAKALLAVERRELMARAQRAEKLAAVGTLAAGLSHEIRNPLNAASLQLTVLERRLQRLVDIPPAVLEPLQLVQAEIQRLNGFLEEFLQYARPRELQRTTLELGELVERVVDLLEPQASALHVRLERSLAPVAPLSADAGRLQQAVMNLVLNAIQATPRDGWVRVALEQRDGAVQLCVEDSGPGVPAELREKIFEPFFTTKEQGSGLGLPLVHAIVNQHEGALTVEEGAGGGARFVLSLPARNR